MGLVFFSLFELLAVFISKDFATRNASTFADKPNEGQQPCY